MLSGAVVVAAGIADGENGFDPLKKIGAISAAERIAATLAKAGIEKTVFVTGFNSLRLEKALADCDVVTLRNAKYASGDMYDSVRIGLRYLQDKCQNILVAPAAIPMFTPETVQALLRSRADYARPCFNGLSGHPVLLSSQLAGRLLASECRGGLDLAIQTIGEAPADIPVDDRGVLFDARRADELEEMREYHSSSLVRPVVTLSLARELPFFNEKCAVLLSLVDQLHSVREACVGIQISYSSGWNMIKNLEEQLGCPLISRTQGGAVGAGRSELTEIGRQMMQLYNSFSKELKENAASLYSKYFDSMLNRKVYLICPGELATGVTMAFQPEEQPLCALGKLRACLLWRELADAGISAACYAPSACCRQTAELICSRVEPLGTEFIVREAGVEDRLLPSLRRLLSQQSGNPALVADEHILRRLLTELFGQAYSDIELPCGSYSVLSLDGSFHAVKLGVRPVPPLGRILCTKMLNTCFIGEPRIQKLIRAAERTVNEAFCAGEDTEDVESAVLLKDIDLADGESVMPASEWLRRLGYDKLADKIRSLKG